MQHTRLIKVSTIGLEFVHVLVVDGVFGPRDPGFGFFLFQMQYEGPFGVAGLALIGLLLLDLLLSLGVGVRGPHNRYNSNRIRL